MENSDNQNEDVWNYSLATLIGKFQNQQIVKNILQGVLSIMEFHPET